MGRLPSLLCLVLVAGCSFTTALGNGSTTVERKHEIADAVIGTIASTGCILAAVAWQSPDEYATTQGNAASWNSPADRTSTIATGREWTPIACAVATVFLNPGSYGYSVLPDGHDDDSSANGVALAAAAGAFANGFLAAQQSHPTFVPITPVAPAAPVGCTSDYGCGPGYECVTKQYSAVGVCLETVDQVGTPRFDPPDPSSVQVKMPSASDCILGTDCSPGFRCDMAAGMVAFVSCTLDMSRA